MIIGLLVANLVLLLFVAWEVALFINDAQLEKASTDVTPQRIKFLAVGDWGRNGAYNQSAVAEAMARKAVEFQPSFVVSTGDNFYESGLGWPEDPAFNTSFIDIYSQPSLQLPWYAVLGNHDYGQLSSEDTALLPDSCRDMNLTDCFYSPLHQLNAELVHRDWRWRCGRAFQISLDGGRVDLFFIDTNPMMGFYRGHEWAKHRGGLLEQSVDGQLAELEAALARSQASWKIVVGHHPVWSNQDENAQPQGYFEGTKALLDPVLNRHGVQAYIHGHDHVLSHIVPVNGSYNQYGSGAGSKLSYGFERDDNAPFQQAINASGNREDWANELRKVGVFPQVWPDKITDLSAVRFALVMNHPEGLLAQASCPNLEAVNGLGHGVDYIARDTDHLPERVKLFRIVDDVMAERMAYWNLWAILNCQRKCEDYLRAQREKRWVQGEVEGFDSVSNARFTVGVMGLGALGGALVEVLLKNGFGVRGWARTRRDEARFRCFAGDEELPAFLSEVRALVCLLPLTPDTRGMLDARLLAMLPRGAYLINAGRGQQQVETDIIAALDCGQLEGAVLDVFETEPLPASSPLWDHPKVRVSPHVSSFTVRDAAVQQVLENWAAVQAGTEVPPERVLQRKRGY